jgi:hypothetical protein
VTTALTWASLVAQLTFIGLMATAIVIVRGDATLRNLSRATLLYGWAIVMQAVSLAAHSLIAEWFWAAVNAATLAAAAFCLNAVRRRRALKAERVQADAERTLREWRGGLR